MPYFHTITRREFLQRSLRAGAGLRIAALCRVPPFACRALAEGNVGRNGKKLLFIFLRGANDALNSCLPVKDDAFTQTIRPTIWIPQEAPGYYDTLGPCDFPAAGATQFSYSNAIRLGNGFNALHPALRFLAPIYNDG